MNFIPISSLIFLWIIRFSFLSIFLIILFYNITHFVFSIPVVTDDDIFLLPQYFFHRYAIQYRLYRLMYGKKEQFYSRSAYQPWNCVVHWLILVSSVWTLEWSQIWFLTCTIWSFDNDDDDGGGDVRNCKFELILWFVSK